MRVAQRTSADEVVLRLRVVGTELPGACFRDPQDPARPIKDPVYVGLQRGREVVDMVRADATTATFTPEFRVTRKARGTANFLGPFAQGTPADRFFYLSWGVMTDGAFSMFRRLKVRLGHLKWSEIERAVRTGRPITVRLRLTDARGGPLCATPPATHVAWET